MSNSAKHRTFVNEVIKVLKEMGCAISIDCNKHYKIKISYGDKNDNWTVSTSPTNRYSAQRSALGDLKRKLKNLGFDDLRPLESSSLLSMMVSDSEFQINTQNIEAQAKALDLGLSPEDIETIGRIVDFSLNNKINSLDAGITILRPDGTPLAACSKFVGVHTTEKGNFGKSHKLKSGLEALLDYYNHCKGIVMMGVVVTDIWRPSNINPLETAMQYYDFYGTKTIFILASGKNLSIIQPPWK